MEKLVFKIDKKIRRLVNKIKENLIRKYGKKIKKVILYGSYARGENTRESDVDILVLIDDSLKTSEVRKSISGLLLNILLKEEEFISVIVLPENFFNSYNYPFLLNVKKEGVLLWKK